MRQLTLLAKLFGTRCKTWNEASCELEQQKVRQQMPSCVDINDNREKGRLPMRQKGEKPGNFFEKIDHNHSSRSGFVKVMVITILKILSYEGNRGIWWNCILSNL
jgi:hypothetical protein